jgi:hypothetical protein
VEVGQWLAFGIEQTPQTLVPKRIIGSAWRLVQHKDTDIPVEIDVDLSMNDKHAPLRADERPYEINEEERLADPGVTSNNCFVETNAESRSNKSVTVADVEFLQRGARNGLIKLESFIRLCSIGYALVEENLARPKVLNNSMLWHRGLQGDNHTHTFASLSRSSISSCGSIGNALSSVLFLRLKSSRLR